METDVTPRNDKTLNFTAMIHWIAFAIFTFIFGYAGLYKVLKIDGMIQGMASMGFHETWTLAIGYAEIIGVAGLLVGIVKPVIKRLAVLWLFPFAIGAFAVHMSYQHTLDDYFNSLLVCILPVILFWTDKRFKLILR